MRDRRGASPGSVPRVRHRLGPDDSGGVEMECTEELGALILCYADCVDAASCGAFDASDLDAATMYGDCVLACPGG